MVIFVHMASVWVPFTSESKEAIADYDEIRKEIKLALQECGRRLGVFLRRRERAESEFRRRNIFELYIEEVVEACARLKGGKLAKEKLKDQLQKIASKRTGGTKTDEILGHEGGGPEGLPHSIIVTAEGTEGEAPMIESRLEAPPEQESFAEVESTAKQTKKAARKKPVNTDDSKGSKSKNDKQMSLALEPGKAAAQRGKKSRESSWREKSKKITAW
jgi:DNA topoisomerase-6 subunit B